MDDKHTPGPWRTGKAVNGFWIEAGHALTIGRTFYETVGWEQEEANARLIAAAPELLEAVAKQLEWFDKERAGPDYGDLARDTHPDGEAIWSRWWNEQLDLCADTERLGRAAIAKARLESLSS